MHPLQLLLPLLLANLQFTLHQNLHDDLISADAFAEGLNEVVVGRDLAFGDVEEDVWDLQDVVEVCLVAGAVGLDGVFVAGDFEAFFALFRRTMETFVSLIWLEGWLIGMVAVLL